MIVVAKRPLHWPLSIQFLHWATVLLLIGLFVSGWIPGAHGVSSLHITLGTLLLAVLLVRIHRVPGDASAGVAFASSHR